MAQMLKKTFALLTLVSISCSTNPDVQNREQKKLRIASAEDFSNLDPRKGRSLATMDLMHLLYEGLYRPTRGVQVKPGVAQEVSISEDGMTFRFLLRHCKWSDGVEVTSTDFLESWKSSLNPQFAAPNAYQLFVIQNAQEIYDGKMPMEALGVETPDEQTLIVHLKDPTQSFLQMVSTPPFFPVPHHILTDQQALPKGERPITNGPFTVESWRPQCDMTLKKNAQYWAISDSYPTSIVTTIVDENTALSLFEKNELDWIGSPLSSIPTDAISELRSKNKLRVAPAAATHFLRVNTRKEQFKSAAVRQTLSQAVQRDEITDHILQGGQIPAESLLPKEFGSLKTPVNFNQALPRDVFASQVPTFSISFVANDRMSKLAQALQSQWTNALGIEVTLIPCDGKSLFQKIKTGDYDLALGAWYADFLDPMNFLAVFERADNGTNNTGWENSEYQALLAQAKKTRNNDERTALYLKADRLLSEECPIIPLYYASYNFLTSKKYSNCTITPLGAISFEE